MNEMEMIRRAKILVEKLVAGETKKFPYCSSSVYWQINSVCLKHTDEKRLKETLGGHFAGTDDIGHGRYHVQIQDKTSCIVYGGFCVRDGHGSGAYDYPYDINLVMKEGVAERIILHGGRNEPLFCIVRSSDAHLYMLRESEVLYIESSHNDLIWHCMDAQLKSRGSLKDLERRLPEGFLRLHRCYIVNVNHIKSMVEREITVTNGDRLLIPARTYAEERRRIRKLCDERMALHSL